VAFLHRPGPDHLPWPRARRNRAQLVSPLGPPPAWCPRSRIITWPSPMSSFGLGSGPTGTELVSCGGCRLADWFRGIEAGHVAGSGHLDRGDPTGW
jgi:hypothetical protein